MHIAPVFPGIEVVLVFLLGLAFGSFATLVSYRLPRGEDIIFTPSRCPKCLRRLGVLDLFPVFSWLFNGGKCSRCKAAVSVRYPLIELIMGFSFAAVYYAFGIGEASAVIMLWTVCLVIVSVISIENSAVPDKLLVAIAVLGIIYRLLPDSYSPVYIIAGPAAAASFGLLLRYISGLLWRGWVLPPGDIKFLAAVGIFLSYELALTFFFIAGIFVVLTVLISPKKNRAGKFPLVPAFAISSYACIILRELGKIFG